MILVCLADGFEEIEALATVDVLRRAGLTVRTVGIGGEKITGSHGIEVTADCREDALPALDALQAVVLPGGMPGTKNLMDSPTVDALLRQAQARGALLCAICAAPSVLGQKGYLQGKKATCYPGFEKYLTGAQPLGEGYMVVTDGRCITAKGAGVAIDFGLAIVQALLSTEKAEKLWSDMQCR
ncbi:MAG: DJ-1/PfpI family protein [Clostridia bacterium]|nr:DJ-1/PfpI family protein [Clostridia bacterium]